MCKLLLRRGPARIITCPNWKSNSSLTLLAFFARCANALFGNVNRAAETTLENWVVKFRTYDDTIGMKELLDGGAFAEEFGIETKRNVRPIPRVGGDRVPAFHAVPDGLKPPQCAASRQPLSVTAGDRGIHARVSIGNVVGLESGLFRWKSNFPSFPQACGLPLIPWELIKLEPKALHLLTLQAAYRPLLTDYRVRAVKLHSLLSSCGRLPVLCWPLRQQHR